MTALTHKENDLHNRLIVAEFNLQQAVAEIRRVHEVNAELVEALQAVTNMGNRSLQLIYESREAADKAKIALHKAQGEIALQRLNKAAEDNGEEL